MCTMTPFVVLLDSATKMRTKKGGSKDQCLLNGQKTLTSMYLHEFPKEFVHWSLFDFRKDFQWRRMNLHKLHEPRVRAETFLDLESRNNVIPCRVIESRNKMSHFKRKFYSLKVFLGRTWSMRNRGGRRRAMSRSLEFRIRNCPPRAWMTLLFARCMSASIFCWKRWFRRCSIFVQLNSQSTIWAAVFDDWLKHLISLKFFGKFNWQKKSFKIGIYTPWNLNFDVMNFFISCFRGHSAHREDFHCGTQRATAAKGPIMDRT